MYSNILFVCCCFLNEILLRIIRSYSVTLRKQAVINSKIPVFWSINHAQTLQYMTYWMYYWSLKWPFPKYKHPCIMILNHDKQWNVDFIHVKFHGNPVRFRKVIGLKTKFDAHTFPMPQTIIEKTVGTLWRQCLNLSPLSPTSMLNDAMLVDLL